MAAASPTHVAGPRAAALAEPARRRRNAPPSRTKWTAFEPRLSGNTGGLSSRAKGCGILKSSFADEFVSTVSNSSGSSFLGSPRRVNFFRVLASDATVAVSSAETKHDSKSSLVHHRQNKERPGWKAFIDFKWIKENKDIVGKNIAERNSSADLELVLKVYEEFLRMNSEVEKFRTERNSIANAMKGKLDPEKRAQLVEEGKKIKDLLAVLEEELEDISSVLQREGQKIPNMTHPDTPRGGEESSFVRKLVGEKRNFDFPIQDHVDIALNLDLVDFDSAAEVTGSKFYYLKNESVLLEMGLVNWTLSKLISKNFVPLTTPDLVRSDVLEKCGFQPRGQNTQVYSIEGSDLCLAGTSEILIGGLFMNKILNESELPIKHVAFSHCFRTEAGAAGAATRGLYRVHQFSKLEMFVVCTPEQSEELHDELISIEEELYTSLGLHYKSLDMASEDLGSPAYRKFDIEAWMPGLERYGEISSASNCTDYQSRRLNIRYRPTPPETSGPSKKSKPQATKFVHTLNATACAVPRMIIAILENFQQEDGSVIVPELLRPYLGGLEVIKPKAKTHRA